MIFKDSYRIEVNHLDATLANAALHVYKRQTYIYPDELREYARVHPGTKIIHGTVGRYAPQEWPSWYVP